MGLMKGFIQDWLEEYGYDLGYDWDNLPTFEKMEKKHKKNVDTGT